MNMNMNINVNVERSVWLFKLLNISYKRKMKVLINGANGRMGKEIAKAIENTEDVVVSCGLDIKEEFTKDFPIYDNYKNIKEDVDVIIDFSIPVATFNVLEYAKENKIPVVIATTGFNEEELKKIEEYSQYIPIFRSSNMSLDINLMASIVKKIAEVLQDTDIEITETHHNKKVDAPSGTAILLADAINEAFEEKKKYNFDRMQNRKPRDKEEIGFSSIRGGNIVGEHTVQFFGENETLEIKHTSYSRQVFAEGAVKAAKYLINQKEGLYSMKDMVN